MNKDAVLKAVEKFGQTEAILGTFSKIIGTDPGGQTTSTLMAMSKVHAATAEEAYALYLLDDANTDRSLYSHSDGSTVVKPQILIGNEESVGRDGSWQDVEYVQEHLTAEGLHIPYEIVDTGMLAQKDVLHIYSVGDATSMTAIAETETAFIVMNWVTSA